MPRLRRGDQMIESRGDEACPVSSDHARSPDNNQRQLQLLTRTNRSFAIKKLPSADPPAPRVHFAVAEESGR